MNLDLWALPGAGKGTQQLKLCIRGTALECSCCYGKSNWNGCTRVIRIDLVRFGSRMRLQMELLKPFTGRHQAGDWMIYHAELNSCLGQNIGGTYRTRRCDHIEWAELSLGIWWPLSLHRWETNLKQLQRKFSTHPLTIKKIITNRRWQTWDSEASFGPNPSICLRWRRHCSLPCPRFFGPYRRNKRGLSDVFKDIQYYWQIEISFTCKILPKMLYEIVWLLVTVNPYCFQRHRGIRSMEVRGQNDVIS